MTTWRAANTASWSGARGEQDNEAWGEGVIWARRDAAWKDKVGYHPSHPDPMVWGRKEKAVDPRPGWEKQGKRPRCLCPVRPARGPLDLEGVEGRPEEALNPVHQGVRHGVDLDKVRPERVPGPPGGATGATAAGGRLAILRDKALGRDGVGVFWFDTAPGISWQPSPRG